LCGHGAKTCAATPHTMKNHPDRLGNALRAGLLAALAAFLATSVSAQTAAPASGEKDETVKLEKFVVTGSFIPIASDTPAVPVTVLSASDIAASGVTTDLTDVLKKTNPFFYGRSNLGNDNANTRSGSTAGASTVSLRNRQTLVLINGRRAAISSSAAIGAGHFVDISLIPVSAVERIEVLSDGASAIYGTDAVSGVVNIILKTRHDGVTVGGSYGVAPDAGNWSSRTANVVFGAGNDKTTVTVAAEWRRSDPLFQFERPWGLNQFRTPSFAGSINANATDFYLLNPSLNAPPQNLDLTPAQLVAQGVYQGPLTQDQVAQFFDLSRKATMFLKTNRRSLSAAAEHRFNENLTAFGDILATQSVTESVLNAQPVSGSVAGTNPFNPFAATVTARNRFIDFPRIFGNDTLGLRVVAGLRGRLGATWNWEVAADLNRTTLLRTAQNQIETAAFNAAQAAGTYNPFARVQAPGVIAGMLGTGYQDYTTRLISFDARINGELLELPAGPLQVAFGVESRAERVAMENDRNERLGAWLGATPTNPFAAKQSVGAFFAELRVPVFSREKNVKFFREFEVGLAARKEIYSKSPDPLVPKFSMRWMPLNDELVFRGTYSESFSAPDLFSLFGPSNSGFTSSINLTRYDASGTSLGVATGLRQYRNRGGSNANLVPSESRNWIAGFVWSPRRVKGLNVTLDWFDIDERDLISVIPAATVLQSVEQLGPASPYFGQIRVGTSVAGEVHFDTGTRVTAPGQITSGASDAVWLSNPRLNVAGVWQSGFDTRIEYTRDTSDWGRFTGSVTATYIHNYTSQTLPTSAPVNFTDSFSGTSTYPRFRTFTRLDWTRGNWSGGIAHTFIPEVDDLGAAVEVPITSYQTFDVRASYRFANSSLDWLKGLHLTVGLNNLLGEDPPYAIGEQDQSRDINTYDAIGRYLYVSASYKF
jgi:iron complex outermembrane receptor protein